MTPRGRARRGPAAVCALLVALAASMAEGRPAAPADPAPALAELRREIESAHPPSLAEQSRRLTGIGERYLASGDPARAIELLSEAVADDPDNGAAAAELTLAYVRHGDLEFAEFYLDAAIRTSHADPADARVFLELGELYAERNRTSEALRAWEEALRLGGDDPSIRARMGKLRRDWAYGHGQQYFEGSAFEAFYDPGVPVDAVESTLHFLDERRTELAGFFESPLAASPVVILYQGRRYFSWMDTPDWVGGVYDGRIHVPLPPDGPEAESYRGLLSHELAHAFISEISRGRAPGWLQEGVAQYVEGRRISAAEAAKTLAVIPLDSLAELSSSFSQRTDRDRARAAYRLALYCVQELIREHGAGAASCVLRDLGAGMPLETAVRAETGRALSDLEAEWRATLRRSAPRRG
ncbi:MAG TPA: tetratricopeptide repeat protein [Thermoanaerobaculia bacterium]|nr:tetratricopeptide repeat protein [Thermoanaerobaculia bacterium]